MKNIAIIPARGGSKRIYKKNIKEFLGKPIIAYSIESAIASGLFETVLVSTDDEKIASVALRYGAEVPFLRSSATSNDYATISDVLKEVLQVLMGQGQEYDNMCCILPTAPLISHVDIEEAYSEFQRDASAAVLYPVVQFSYPVQRCLKLDGNFQLSMKWPEYKNSRSQDLEKLYHDSGTFYWYRIDLWMAGSGIRRAVVLDEHRVQDIDTEEDWLLAELKYKFLNEKKTEGLFES